MAAATTTGSVAAGPHSRLFVYDQGTERTYLIDTGAALSVLPREPQQPLSEDYKLYAANGTVIPTYGQTRLQLNLGLRRDLTWTFVNANVSHPILGADFLSHYNLLVDLSKRRLIDQITGFTVTGRIGIGNTPGVFTIPKETPFSQLLARYPRITQPQDINVFPDQSTGINDVLHHIETKGPPIRSRARRLNPSRYKLAKAEFQNMIREGICQPSNSPWSSPLHIVDKKDGTIRPCGDYRQLNSQTIPDRYGVPHIADFTNQLHGTKIYSTLDIRRAYHHIRVNPEDVPKTAIITPFGLFEFKRMTFGLRNAAQSFQRYMDKLFRSLPFVYIYLDDVLVSSTDEQEHKEHLEAVFEILNDNHLTLNVEKCRWGQPTVPFLGYQVSATGIIPLPEKVQAISEYPRPTTVKELRRFLGVVNFYRKSLPHAAEDQRYLTRYLRNAKKNDRTPIPWEAESNSAFERIKQSLMNATQLAHPAEDSNLILACDASDRAMGAVLQQTSGDDIQPLGFFSRAFSSAQVKYSTYDRELQSIFDAIRYFRTILEGRNFIIHTDHKPLIHAMHQTDKTASPRRLRQLNFISQFTTDIRYCPGDQNTVADALSRIEEICLPTDYIALAEAQKTDTTLQQLIEKGERKFRRITIPGLDVEITCEIGTSSPRPYLPEKFRKTIFTHLHELCHPGARASKKLITTRYFWPEMNRDITSWVKTCNNCQLAKIHRHNITPCGTFQPSSKFEHVHLDIIGPFPPSEGMRYCLTMIDRGTSWPEAIPTDKIDAVTIAGLFFTHWVSRFGVPLRITTDQGRQFESDLFDRLTKLLGITRIRTTAFHPKSNGILERWHRSLKTALRTKLHEPSWTKSLPTVLLGLRSTLKYDGETSVAEQIYGQPLRLPGEIFQTTPDDSNIHLQALKKEFRRLYPKDCHNHFVNQDLKTATHAFLKNHIQTGLQAPYSGPYKIINRNDKTASLQLPNRVIKVSLDRIKPAYQLSVLTSGTDYPMPYESQADKFKQNTKRRHVTFGTPSSSHGTHPNSSERCPYFNKSTVRQRDDSRRSGGTPEQHVGGQRLPQAQVIGTITGRPSKTEDAHESTDTQIRPPGHLVVGRVHPSSRTHA